MSKMSKAIVALGVVAGLGVAALPLSSYAVSTQAQVQVEVGGAISISTDADSGKVDLGKLTVNGVSESKDLNVTVTSNSEVGFDLTIMSATNETSLTNENGATIPAGTTIAAGTSAWAYKVDDGAWTKITNSAVSINNHTVDTDNTGGMSEPTKITFGASANGTQQEGTYTGTVLLTATVQ